MRRRILYILAVTAAMLLGIAPVVSGTASAQSNTTNGNPIWCGLWSGSNFDISGDCPPTSPTPQPNPNPQPQANVYAALGDSVAAGLGLPSSDPQCGRSDEGYPNIVARNADLPLVNVSCSGATVGDLFTKQGVPGPNIPAQLDTAFAQGTPKLITITAGANDAHWADFVKACYAYNCGSSSYNYTAAAYIKAMKVKLHYALADIRARSGGNLPQVIVTGYYYPFSSVCANDQLTSAELAWLNSEWRGLNAAIQDVSNHYSFVKYVPVNFSGHDVCSADPWVQGPDDPAPFHPTTAGQQAIANAVSQKL